MGISMTTIPRADWAYNGNGQRVSYGLANGTRQLTMRPHPILRDHVLRVLFSLATQRWTTIVW